MKNSMWIFAYGSLIWRPHFSYKRSVKGFIRGYERRFWQGSPDHRGTEDSPGRVVTLNECNLKRCWGVAFELTEDEYQATIDSLDHRERGGYTKIIEQVYLDSFDVIDATVYYASQQNHHYLGAASNEVIAKQIKVSSGESGSNLEYLINLSSALKKWRIRDSHVEGLIEVLGL